MIRAVANQRLDLSNEEYEVYKNIIDFVDKSEFIDTFKTDNNGKIIAVLPPVKKNVSMVVIYFLYNVMINQRVRSFDGVIEEVKNISKRLDKLEGGEK